MAIVSELGQAVIDGGGLRQLFYVAGAHLVLFNLRLTRGAASSGGAVQLIVGGGRDTSSATSPSALTAYGCEFDNNAAVNGGAVSNEGGSVALENCTLRSNTASNDGGAISSKEHTYNFSPTLSVVSSRLSLNSAEKNGGAIFNSAWSQLSMAGSELAQNFAGNDGWAIYALSSSVVDLDLEVTTTAFFTPTNSTQHSVVRRPSLIFSSGATIEWGWCAPGWSPGEASANLNVRDVPERFEGCPIQCPAGSFGSGGDAASIRDQSDWGIVIGCEPCPPGSVCPELAMAAPRLCTPGFYGPFEQDASDSCRHCETGKFQAASGATDCTSCPAGTFSSAKSSTACELCGAGGYCEEPGASSASIFTQCEPGTWSDAVGANSSATCQGCPAGRYSPITGAASASDCRPCRKGGFCPERSDEPTDCAAGTYQNSLGQTACDVCPAGSYCGAGAVEPLPCPGGTYSREVGLTSQLLCTKVVKGEWAPTGSSAPELCPVSGFYCPGYDADTINDPPGSKPILIDSGAARATHNVTVVTFTLTLDAEVAGYDANATRAGVAALYGVSPDDIALSVVAGSLVLNVTISVSASAGGEAAAAAALAGAVGATGAAELAAALGAPATVERVAIGIVAREREALCPAGAWCSVGVTIPCPENTYNNLTNRTDEGACRACPPNAVSPKGSVSASACLCSRGYYERRWLDAEGAAEGAECAVCPLGSDCVEEGATLATLPLLPGYYRTGNTSDDLRRCPNGDANASGCVGGVSADGREGPCKPWLEGPYCTLCNVTDTSRYYSHSEQACLACDGDLTLPVALLAAALVVAVCVTVLWARFEPHNNVRALRWLLGRLTRVWAQLSLRAKGKQLLGFYQVATRVGDIYEVPMPSAINTLLRGLEVLNINFIGIGLPLQCLGLGTYEQQLAFTMILPLVLAVVTVLVAVVRRFCRRGERRGGGVDDADVADAAGAGGGADGTPWLQRSMLDALPWLLYLSFLVFPMVSSAAFRAFSCEDFDDGKSYLRTDYAVECGSEVHARAEALAWLGIGLYPIGISLLYVVLLLRARRAILDDKPTELSRALYFLVRDYEPAYMWWELVEAWKKLFLVGFAVLILPGSVEQLIIAFLFAAIHGLMEGIAAPFAADDNVYFGKACSFSLVSFLFFSLVLKVGVLTEELGSMDGVLTPRMRSRFGFDAVWLSVGMLLSVVGALLLAAATAVQQVYRAQERERRRAALEKRHHEEEAQLKRQLASLREETRKRMGLTGAALRNVPTLVAGERGQPFGGAPGGRVVINEPGQWHFMISYSQRARVPPQIAIALASQLQRRGYLVWLDVDMPVRNVAAMREGVENSMVVVCILNSERPGDEFAYFMRPFCRKEMNWALANEAATGGAWSRITPVVDVQDQRVAQIASDISDEQLKAGDDPTFHLSRASVEAIVGRAVLPYNTTDADYKAVGELKLIRCIEAMAGPERLSEEALSANAAADDEAAAASHEEDRLPTELPDGASHHCVLSFAPERAAMARQISDSLTARGYVVRSFSTSLRPAAVTAAIDETVALIPLISDGYLGWAAPVLARARDAQKVVQPVVHVDDKKRISQWIGKAPPFVRKKDWIDLHLADGDYWECGIRKLLKGMRDEAAKLPAARHSFVASARDSPRQAGQVKPARLRRPSGSSQAGSDASSRSAGGSPRRASKDGWDSTCLAAAAASERTPPRTPGQVCLSSAALDALDPGMDLSA